MKIFTLLFLLFYVLSTFSQSNSPSFVDSYLVKGIGNEETPRYFDFNSDGTKLFVAGGTNDRLLEYTLSTGFDFSTLSYAGNSERFNLHLNNATGDSQPRDVAFNNDGTKIFVIGNSADEVNEYSLATAFDISTASFDSRIDLSSTVGGAPNALEFNTDGTKMFITSNSSSNIFVFNLITGFDISTSSFSSSESISGHSGGTFRGISFKPDGTKMFLISNSGSSSSNNDNINEFNLSTAFDVSSSSFAADFDISSYEIDPQGIKFNNDGSRIYVLGTSGDDVNEFILPDNYSLYQCSPCYSINNGAWRQPGVWSTTAGGSSCNCYPVSTDDAIITSHTVDLQHNTQIHNLTIQSGSLLLDNLKDLEIMDGGSLTMNNGTSITGVSGDNFVQLHGNVTVTLNGTGDRISDINGFLLYGSGSITFNGTADFSNVGKLKYKSTNIDFVSNLTGNFTVNEINFNNKNNNSFTNNAGSTITLLSNLKNSGNNNIFTNNGTINVGTNLENGSSTGDNFTVTNSGTMTVSSAVNPNNNTWTINNSGSFTHEGDYQGASNLTINNLSGATWYSKATDHSAATFNCDADPNTFIFNGASSQTIPGNSTTTYHNVIIANTITDADAIVLNADINVNSVLNIAMTNGGDVLLNGYTIDLGTTGSISGESSDDHIYGPLGSITTTVDLPSTSTTYSDISGLGFDITTGASQAPGSTQITRTHGEQTGVGYTSILRTFDIVTTNSGYLDATLNFHYFDSELNGQSTSSALKLWESVDGGWNWNNRGGTQVSDYVSLTGINTFDTWTISDQSTSPLPITLILFKVHPSTNNNVILEWETALEINNDFFTIERSIDLINWELVSIIQGAGNSSSIKGYSVIDDSPYAGISYYRLKQTDFGGNINYSTIISTQFTPKPQLSIYPNPCGNQLTIIGMDDVTEEIIICNAIGKDLTERTSKNIEGNDKVTIDLSQLRPGVYYVKTKNFTIKTQKQ